MKKIEVKTFVEFEECECGGIFSKQMVSAILKTEFACNQCDKVKSFYDRYPKVTFEWLEEIIAQKSSATAH